MSNLDSAHRVYIRAYRNRWDAEKTLPCVKARIQVGRLLGDGSIRFLRAFEQASLSFQGQPCTEPIKSSCHNGCSSSFFWQTKPRKTSARATNPFVSVSHILLEKWLKNVVPRWSDNCFRGRKCLRLIAPSPPPINDLLTAFARFLIGDVAVLKTRIQSQIDDGDEEKL